mgnify:CR=1 FL=1
MLNSLWAGMILIGIIFGAWNGKMPELTNAALDSSKDAVSLCITMLGVMAFWCGIMEIAEKAGLVKKAAEKLRPVIRFLFPQLPVGNKANEQIAINFIANILGLGWAATPAGIKAMEELEKLEDERRKSPVLGKRGVPKGIANTEMCTFLIVNISSLQLIPINIIAYRTQYGSTNPTRIVGAAILATTVSTVVGVIFAWVMERVKKV